MNPTKEALNKSHPRHPEPRRRRRISKWQVFAHVEILRRAMPPQDDGLFRGSLTGAQLISIPDAVLDQMEIEYSVALNVLMRREPDESCSSVSSNVRGRRRKYPNAEYLRKGAADRHRRAKQPTLGRFVFAASAEVERSKATTKADFIHPRRGSRRGCRSDR